MICAEPSSSSVLCLQVLSLRHRRLVRPSPESIQSRSRWLRPTCASKPWRRSKPNMAGTRNPFGRRSHPGSRIHLQQEAQPPKNRRQKEILAKRTAKPRSHRMKTAVKSPNPAKSRRPAEHSSFQRFSFQHFSFTQIPLSPATPISPPSSLRRGYDRQAGPIHWLFQGPPAESKFLAARVSTTSCHLAVKVRIRVIPEASSRLGRHEEAALAF